MKANDLILLSILKKIFLRPNVEHILVKTETHVVIGLLEQVVG